MPLVAGIASMHFLEERHESVDTSDVPGVILDRIGVISRPKHFFICSVDPSRVPMDTVDDCLPVEQPPNRHDFGGAQLLS